MFDAKLEKDKIVKFIRDYFKENNVGGVVIGISGGKDSGVVAALLVEALGKENVIGVTLPCHSASEDAIDAKLVSDYYGFELINLDITSTFDTFKKKINQLGNFNEEELKEYDMIVFPGGLPGADNLAKDDRVINIIKYFKLEVTRCKR